MKIAILGFGTVGRGVYEILKQRDTKNTAQLEAAHIFIRDGKKRFSIAERLGLTRKADSDTLYKKRGSAFLCELRYSEER